MGSIAARGTRLLAGLTSTPRRVWLTTFVLATSLSAVWALSQPVLAGPDEPAHVVRADAIAHGLIGSEPRERLPRVLRPVDDDVRIVRAPEIYGSVVIPCFAHQRDLLPPCLRFSGPTTDSDVASYEALQPPAYYAVVGLTSWLSTPGSRAVYMMRLVSAVLTGAFIATAFAAVRRSAAPRLLSTGVVIAITPMVLFLGGVVGPAGTEIAAAIAFWVCGLVLLSRAADRVERSLVTGAGIAGCVLALSRPLGPLWIGLIALALACVSSRTALRTVARSGRARVWAALVVAAMAVQVAWNVIAGPRDATLTGHVAANLSTVDQLADSFGATFGWYREMIGSFGWNETLTPTLTWVPWTAALGFLFFAALAWVARRCAGVLLALVAAVIVVPIVFELTPYHVDGGSWLGSSTLPLAVGVPILAAHGLTTTARGRDLLASRFVLAVGVIAGVGQFLAFAANLRRYTVGGSQDLLYWFHAQWDPPLPPLLLTAGYAVLVAAFLTCVLGLDGRRATEPQEARPSPASRPALDTA
jgi:hypothetical protein